MGSYTNQEQVEAFIKRSLSENELVLFDSYLSAVESFINSKIKGVFGSVELSSKYYDGGKNIIDIDGCHDVESVKLVGSDESESYSYNIDTELELCPRNESNKRWIEKRYGCFPVGVRNIEVRGKFSLGDIPDDVKYLSTVLMGSLVLEGFNGKLASESIEGYSRAFAVSLASGEVSTKKDIIDSILSLYMENEAPLI